MSYIKRMHPRMPLGSASSRFLYQPVTPSRGVLFVRAGLRREGMYLSSSSSSSSWRRLPQSTRNVYFSSNASSPSSLKTPRFRIPAHMALFSLVFFPTVGFSMIYAAKFGPTEEGLENEIRKRYQTEMNDSGISEKNKHMGVYFQQVFGGDRPADEVDSQLTAVLHGGKDKYNHGRQRKFDALGEKLREKAATIEQAPLEDTADKDGMVDEEEPTKRKKKKKKKKQKQAVVQEEIKKDEVKQKEDNVSAPETPSMMSQNSVVYVAAIAVIAATAGFVAGGRRSS